MMMMLSRLVSRGCVGGGSRHLLQRGYRGPQNRAMLSSMLVFDRNAKRLQKDRAGEAENARDFEMLKDEVAYLVSERLEDFTRVFEKGLDLGCNRGHLGAHVDEELVKHLVQTDISSGMLASFDADARDLDSREVLDEERITFESNSFDVVLSSLSLHWVNDLPGALVQIKNILKPDAPFIGTMFGGESLYELRVALQLAEQERKGGMSTHISPFAEMSDVGELLHRAGFNLITVDTAELVVKFPSMLHLMQDLRGMGESNACLHRPTVLSRDTIMAANAIYQEMYGNEDGTIPATFQIIHMVGWKPDPSQPKPAERGSANYSLKDISSLSS